MAMNEWHIDDRALGDWVQGTDRLAQSASVEAHLLSCAPCRERVTLFVHHEQPSIRIDVDDVWGRVRDAIELPAPSPFERLLVRLGLPAPDAKLVAAAYAFRSGWSTAVLFVLAFVGLASGFGNASGEWAFLAAAPILPCLGVALSYEPAIEPALEQELATPYPALRLVLLRSIAVLAGGLPLVVVFGFLMPVHAPFVWLLPAAGFVTVVLALSTWISPLRAAIGVSAVWLAAIWLSVVHSGSAHGLLHDRYLVGYVALAVLSSVVFVARRRHLREPRPRGGWL
jgi:hypothetical protein